MGCATTQIEHDIAVIRDELDSLRADYKRQSRDVEFLTAKVLTLNAQAQRVPQTAQIQRQSVESSWQTPPRKAVAAQKVEPPVRVMTRVDETQELEPELPPIVLTMADLDNIGSPRLKVSPMPAAPDFGLAAASVPETAQAQEDFSTGLNHYADGKLIEAVEAFRSYLITHSSSNKRFDVYFWLGETLLELNQLNEAILSFQHVVQHPKLSTRVPDALYKMGLCHRRSKREEQAQELFRRVVDDYPSSAVSSLARTQLTRGEL